MECDLSKKKKKAWKGKPTTNRKGGLFALDDNSTFLNLVDLTVQLECLGKFIDKSSNKYMQQAVCCGCTGNAVSSGTQDGLSILRSAPEAQFGDELKPDYGCSYSKSRHRDLCYIPALAPPGVMYGSPETRRITLLAACDRNMAKNDGNWMHLFNA
ncbi:hypothetical protein JB92DRAFT_2827256 [Gautieria morchelliformis]|nr:hypothetical protein JB92DRAFT_2827256 [Gautieria morchelliformis]